MVCFELDEESMRNPNGVSILLCACFKQVQTVPTHSNKMKEMALMSVSHALWKLTGRLILFLDVFGIESVAIGKPERQARKASHCGNKEQ